MLLALKNYYVQLSKLAQTSAVAIPFVKNKALHASVDQLEQFLLHQEQFKVPSTRHEPKPPREDRVEDLLHEIKRSTKDEELSPVQSEDITNEKESIIATIEEPPAEDVIIPPVSDDVSVKLKEFVPEEPLEEVEESKASTVAAEHLSEKSSQTANLDPVKQEHYKHLLLNIEHQTQILETLELRLVANNALTPKSRNLLNQDILEIKKIIKEKKINYGLISP